MEETYQTTATTGFTTDIADIPLDEPEDDKVQLTRKVLRSEFVANKKEPHKAVRATILHQRRHSAKEPWQDAEAFSLATIKAGQEVRMYLPCFPTYELYKALHNLYAIAGGRLPEAGKTLAVVDTQKATVVSGDAHRVLKDLLETEGENMWNVLDQLKPGLLEVAALKQQHQHRSKALAAFRKRLNDPAVKEEHWQKFFERNDWIFGHGLEYRFLSCLEAQANLGGTEMDRKGGVRGDFLMATKARLGFTVLVDIKTPSTPLVGKHQYRNKAWSLGEELLGGVAQVQAQCATWAEEGAQQRNNAERLLKEDIYTCEPRGFLIVGNLEQLADDADKRNTFERFRRNLHNPQVITFDELLQRAEFMVNQAQLETITQSPQTMSQEAVNE